MSSYVEVRGVKIGEGVPKICVPIVGKTKEEILAAAKSFADVKMDVVEWRVDWFDGVFDFCYNQTIIENVVVEGSCMGTQADSLDDGGFVIWREEMVVRSRTTQLATHCGQSRESGRYLSCMFCVNRSPCGTVNCARLWTSRT